MASAADQVVALYNQGVRGVQLTRRIRQARNLSQEHAELAVARARSSGRLGIYKPLTQDPAAARRARQNFQGSPAEFAAMLDRQGYRGGQLGKVLRASGLSQRHAETAISRARSAGNLSVARLTDAPGAARRTRANFATAREFIAELHHQGYRDDELQAIAVASGLSARHANLAVDRARSEGLIPGGQSTGGGGGSGGGGGGPTPGTDPEAHEPAPEVPDLNPLFAVLKKQLDAIGLGSLYTIDSDGNPGGWLWKQIQSGVDTADELLIAIESTNAYKERFAVIEEQKQRAANGQPGGIMTPREVIEYEQAAREQMASYGLPKRFYDRPGDFAQLILNNMSITELNQRLENAYDYVKSAPREVKRAFERFFGVGRSDGALAAFVLDPDRTTSRLEDMARSAYVGGMGERFGIALGRSMSERLADLPHTEAGFTQGLSTIASQAEIFREGIFETTDLTAEGEGVAAQFLSDADAQAAIERRLAERGRNRQAATGGAVLTGEGLTGVGSSG